MIDRPNTIQVFLCKWLKTFYTYLPLVILSYVNSDKYFPNCFYQRDSATFIFHRNRKISENLQVANTIFKHSKEYSNSIIIYNEFIIRTRYFNQIRRVRYSNAEQNICDFPELSEQKLSRRAKKSVRIFILPFFSAVVRGDRNFLGSGDDLTENKAFLLIETLF